MSVVPSYLRSRVVEGGDRGLENIGPELLLTLVDAVEENTAEQKRTTDALERIAHALTDRSGYTIGAAISTMAGKS